MACRGGSRGGAQRPLTLSCASTVVSMATDVVYVPVSLVDTLLQKARPRLVARMASADMISVQEAAELTGETESMVRRWIARQDCIAVSVSRLPMRLPRWQFEDSILLWIGPISFALGARTSNGWAVLSFLEAPQDGLDGRTPRQALEQGDAARVLAVATFQ